jgi:hypothetical protein
LIRAPHSGRIDDILRGHQFPDGPLPSAENKKAQPVKGCAYRFHHSLAKTSLFKTPDPFNNLINTVVRLSQEASIYVPIPSFLARHPGYQSVLVLKVLT